MTKDEALKLALEALETGGWNKTTAAITALRERLAKPEQTISMTEYKRLQDLVTSQGIRLMEYESAHPKQEPFCYHDGRNIVGKEFADHSDVFPLYTSPKPAVPERKPLMDEEIDKLPWEPHEGNPMTFAEGLRYFARAIEAAHGIKGSE